MYDTLSFGSSVTSLVIYFFMPVIQEMTFVQGLVQPVAMLLGVISLTFMLLAFSAGVAAVLDEKSSLYSLTNDTVAYGLYFPVYLFGIIFFIFLIPLIYIRNKLRPFRSWSSFHRLSISRGLVVLAPEFVLSFLPQPMCSGRQFVL